MFKIIGSFFSLFGSLRSENSSNPSNEAAKNAKMEQKRQRIEAKELRKMDIRNMLRVDPSSRQWLDHTDVYAEQARERELVLERAMNEESRRLTSIGTEESLKELERLTIEHDQKRDESIITRMMSMLKYQMYDLFQFYHILRWEEKRFDIYKAQVEEYLSKYIEDALFLENLMRKFCADPKNTRYSLAIFQPAHIECIKERAIAYHLQIQLLEVPTARSKPPKQLKAAYCNLEGVALSLPDLPWNLKTKEWMLEPSKKAKKNKKDKKQQSKTAVNEEGPALNEPELKSKPQYSSDMIDFGEQARLLSHQYQA